ncbi:U3 snoRNP protein [Agyrium rufum]|nr:U3 snoRNP protein [Agyrium rufum]
MAPGLLLSPSHSSLEPYPHPAPTDLHPSSEQLFQTTLSATPYDFLTPAPSLYAAALLQSKQYLDALATSVSTAQEQRLNAARKRKRKRGTQDDRDLKDVLRLKQVHTEGFDVNQIWQQARRVLEASQVEFERVLPLITKNANASQNGSKASHRESDGVPPVKTVHFDEEGFEVGSGEEDEGEELSGIEDDLLDDGDLDESGLEAEELDDIEDAELEEDLDDIEVAEEDILGSDADADRGESEVFVPDKNGLNDGFFSIDDFNKQSEFLEQQDERGDPDNAASDEEDIDWNTNPADLAASEGRDRYLDEDDDNEDGPTFGNADLNAPFSDDDAEDQGLDGEDDPMDGDASGLMNTNEILYKDFYEPPPRALTKTARRRALPKTQPPPSAQPSEADLQRTISAVRRDLFEDDFSEQGEGGSGSDDLDLSDPDSKALPPNTKGLSSHQRRQAALTAQIRKLEAANIAKREWQLAGEARAQERPVNSLLEEDLDFERVGKPVGVVTAEVSEDIEALIKRRILAREFDEIIRRRPGSLTDLRQSADQENKRRGRYELSDAKDVRGLGEVYEEEHLQNTEGSGFVDAKDKKLKAQHEEIESLWRDVSAKLDALASFNFRPKPAEVSIKVVSDAPRVTMEDARPAGVVGVAGAEENMLAPQEIYKISEGSREKGEVVVGAGDVRAKEEETREQKVRRRRREKERLKKSGAIGGKKVVVGKDGKVQQSKGEKRREEKDDVLKELKRGGVKVIGKKGEIRDVEGEAVKSGKAAGTAGGFKL